MSVLVCPLHYPAIANCKALHKNDFITNLKLLELLECSYQSVSALDLMMKLEANGDLTSTSIHVAVPKFINCFQYFQSPWLSYLFKYCISGGKEM